MTKVSTKRHLDIEFMNELFPQLLLSRIYCMMIGTVTRFDGEVADVQPAPLQSDDSKRPVIIECPILQSALIVFNKDGFAVKKALKVGDKVLVGFHDRDLENYRGQKTYKLATKRMHSINDGIVLGKL